eukprot:658360-Rhodomonas_salina.2
MPDPDRGNTAARRMARSWRRSLWVAPPWHAMYSLCEVWFSLALNATRWTLFLDAGAVSSEDDEGGSA